MNSVVVPIEEGSGEGWMADHVIGLYRQQPLRIYLLNVRQPLAQYVARFIAKAELEAFHQENGMRALKPAADRLDACGVPHWDLVLVGQKAESIVGFARDHHCSQIILPKPAGGALAYFGLGSISSQIRHLIGAAGGSCGVSEVY
ncbi:MAG TPA: universal stress protein [Burkholderiales bacterium]